MAAFCLQMVSAASWAMVSADQRSVAEEHEHMVVPCQRFAADHKGVASAALSA